MQAVRKAVLWALPPCDRMVEELIMRTRDVNDEVTAVPLSQSYPPTSTAVLTPSPPPLGSPSSMHVAVAMAGQSIDLFKGSLGQL